MRTRTLGLAAVALASAALLAPVHSAPAPPERAPGEPPPTDAELRRSATTLKLIGIAIHSYHDAFNRLPADVVGKDGKPLLSWRVLILPYIEQENLFNQFKLDEPWDSPNNKKLSETIVKLYAPVRGKAPKDHTFYQGFTGPNALFRPGKPYTMANIANADGTSLTIMVVEAGESVPWAKPGGLAFDPKKPLPKLGGLFGGDFHALMCDGSVRYLKKSTPEKTIKALITPQGGEPVKLP